MQRTVQEEYLLLPSSGVAARLVDHKPREPSKSWLHHVLTESATRVRENPGKETRGWVGGFCGQRRTCSPRGVLRLLPSPSLFHFSVWLPQGRRRRLFSVLRTLRRTQNATHTSRWPAAHLCRADTSTVVGAGQLNKRRQCHCIPASEANWLCCRRYHDLRHLATNAISDMRPLNFTKRQAKNFSGRKVRTLKIFRMYTSTKKLAARRKWKECPTSRV